MSDIILADRGSENSIIEEEKVSWINRVLNNLGINPEILAETEELPTHLKLLKIDIIRNIESDNIDIFREGVLIAQWKFPKLILKQEGKIYYYEIHLEEWS